MSQGEVYRLAGAKPHADVGNPLVAMKEARDYSKLNEVIGIHGHSLYIEQAEAALAVYRKLVVTRDASPTEGDRLWYGGYKGQGNLYLGHVIRALELAEKHPNAFVRPSGGATKQDEEGRPIAKSEGGTYAELMRHLNYIGITGIKDRVGFEDRARDTPENVIFVITESAMARGGKLPDKVIMVGFEFKRPIVELVAQNLKSISSRDIEYVGANDLPGSLADPNSDLSKGTKWVKGILEELETTSPFGNAGELLRKKDLRDPFRRGPAAWRLAEQVLPEIRRV